MSLELLSLGLDFMGGLMGRSEAKKNRQMQQQQMAQAQKQFDAQMDQSVQRRVADAKAAGVHPLFALGASSGASPTISAQGGSSSSNPMGSALARMASTLGVIEQNKASARKDEAEAQLMDSERARIEQEMNTRGQPQPAPVTKAPDSETTVKTFPVPDSNPIGEAEYFKPQIPKSKAPGIVAGEQPGTMDVRMPDGRKVNILNPDLNMDEISQIDYAYQRAVHKGADAFEWIANQAKKKGWVLAPFRKTKGKHRDSNEEYWKRQKQKTYPIRRN